MIQRPFTVLTIEFDLDADPIAGRLLDETQTSHAFTGWVGLTHALRTALAAAGGSPQHPHRSGRTP